MGGGACLQHCLWSVVVVNIRSPYSRQFCPLGPCAISSNFPIPPPTSLLFSQTVEVEEVVPLFHSPLNLLPMLETALLQLDQHFGASGAKIVGYYQANELMEDNG